MQDKGKKPADEVPAGAARGRAPLAAIVISSLATIVMIAVIIAGSLYAYHLFPNVRPGSLAEELMGWVVVLLGGLACLAIILLSAKLRRWLASRGAR
jgi:hypothetical protein